MTKVDGGYTAYTLSLKNLQDRDQCIDMLYMQIKGNFTYSMKTKKHLLPH